MSLLVLKVASVVLAIVTTMAAIYATVIVWQMEKEKRQK